MGELIDKAKGKAKQVGGIITGDKELQNEGKLDEAKGDLKGVANKVGAKIDEAVASVKQAVKKI